MAGQITGNGSLSNNLFCLLISLDTCARKSSNIRFSRTSF